MYLQQVRAQHALTTQAQGVNEGQRTIQTTDEVLKRIQVSRPTLYRLLSSGLFPRPFKIGFRKNGWLKGDIDAWIDSRAEGVA